MTRGIGKEFTSTITSGGLVGVNTITTINTITSQRQRTKQDMERSCSREKIISVELHLGLALNLEPFIVEIGLSVGEMYYGVVTSKMVDLVHFIYLFFDCFTDPVQKFSCTFPV